MKVIADTIIITTYDEKQIKIPVKDIFSLIPMNTKIKEILFLKNNLSKILKTENIEIGNLKFGDFII